jgi:hypothetical protein
MPKLRFLAVALALAAAFLPTQSATAASNVVDNFNPAISPSGYWSVDDLTSTSESITISILNYSFAPGAVGTYYMNEEAPFIGLFGSDSIDVSNSGANGWGVINFISADMPPAAQGLCNGVPDEGQSGYCNLSLSLVGGPTLFVTAFSPAAGQEPDPSFSDSLRITTVPEPESYAMMLAGLGLLGFAARRRKLRAA